MSPCSASAGVQSSPEVQGSRQFQGQKLLSLFKLSLPSSSAPQDQPPKLPAEPCLGGECATEMFWVSCFGFACWFFGFFFSFCSHTPAIALRSEITPSRLEVAYGMLRDRTQVGRMQGKCYPRYAIALASFSFLSHYMLGASTCIVQAYS